MAFLLHNFLHLTRQFERLYSKTIQQAAQKHGLSKTEADVLLFLYNNPEYDTARDIVEFRGIAKSYVSKTIELLIQKGFLLAQENENDRRMIHLKLQDNKLDVVRELKHTQEELFTLICRNISDHEREQLSLIFTKLSQNIKEVL